MFEEEQTPIETLIDNSLEIHQDATFFRLQAVTGSRNLRLLGLQMAQHCATVGVETSLFSHGLKGDPASTFLNPNEDLLSR